MLLTLKTSLAALSVLSLLAIGGREATNPATPSTIADGIEATHALIWTVSDQTRADPDYSKASAQRLAPWGAAITAVGLGPHLVISERVPPAVCAPVVRDWLRQKIPVRIDSTPARSTEPCAPGQSHTITATLTHWRNS